MGRKGKGGDRERESIDREGKEGRGGEERGGREKGKGRGRGCVIAVGGWKLHVSSTTLM